MSSYVPVPINPKVNPTLQRKVSYGVQLQSVKTNELFQRRVKSQSLVDLSMEADKILTIPDEHLPTDKIRAPAIYAKWTDLQKLKRGFTSDYAKAM